MSWINQHLVEVLFIVGLALLAIEIGVLGFSTFILFFIGLAAVLSGVIFFVGLVPESMVNAVLLVGIITLVSAAVLWKPLKNMQQKVDDTPAKNDLIGHEFVLTDDVSRMVNPVYRYSGIDWKLTSDSELAAGTLVEVIKTEVGVFHVKEVI